MITILISCSDSSIMEQIARNIIRMGDGVCIFSTKTAKEAWEIIEKNVQQIDIFILDISLKDIGGCKLESELRSIRRYQDTPVIFLSKASGRVTAPSKRSTYQTYRKCNYLSLPINDLDVQGKIGLYLDRIREQRAKRKHPEAFVFKHTKGYIKLDVQSIIFVEVQNKSCRICTLQGEFLLKGKSLNSLQAELSADDSDSLLIRCHRSYLLSLQHLAAIEQFSRRNWTAFFSHTEETCPISNNYIKEVYRKYKQA